MSDHEAPSASTDRDDSDSRDPPRVDLFQAYDDLSEAEEWDIEDELDEIADGPPSSRSRKQRKWKTWDERVAYYAAKNKVRQYQENTEYMLFSLTCYVWRGAQPKYGFRTETWEALAKQFDRKLNRRSPGLRPASVELQNRYQAIKKRYLRLRSFVSPKRLPEGWSWDREKGILSPPENKPEDFQTAISEGYLAAEDLKPFPFYRGMSDLFKHCREPGPFDPELEFYTAEVAVPRKGKPRPKKDFHEDGTPVRRRRVPIKAPEPYLTWEEREDRDFLKCCADNPELFRSKQHQRDFTKWMLEAPDSPDVMAAFIAGDQAIRKIVIDYY